MNDETKKPTKTSKKIKKFSTTFSKKIRKKSRDLYDSTITSTSGRPGCS